MGMSASQARLLFITSRINDVEFKTQQIANQKLRLADESSRISDDYAKALNERVLTVYDRSNNSSQQLSYNAIMSPDGAMGKENYLLRTADGKVVISQDIANAIEGSSNISEFFAKLGYEYNGAGGSSNDAGNASSGDTTIAADMGNTARTTGRTHSDRGLATFPTTTTDEATDTTDVNSNTSRTTGTTNSGRGIANPVTTTGSTTRTTDSATSTPASRGTTSRSTSTSSTTSSDARGTTSSSTPVTRNTTSSTETRVIGSTSTSASRAMKAPSYAAPSKSTDGINKIGDLNKDAVNGVETVSPQVQELLDVSVAKKSPKGMRNPLGGNGTAGSTDTTNTGRTTGTNSGLATPTASERNYYESLYNAINPNKYTVINSDAMKQNDYLQFQLEQGNWFISKKGASGNYENQSLSSLTNISEEIDRTKMAQAEAEYNAATTKLNKKEKILDMELKKQDTEHQALQTEYESAKKIINDNIEQSFKMFS